MPWQWWVPAFRNLAQRKRSISQSTSPQFNGPCSWLVVWNIFFFLHILEIVTPTNFHIFQRGWNHQPCSLGGLFTWVCLNMCVFSPTGWSFPIFSQVFDGHKKGYWKVAPFHTQSLRGPLTTGWPVVAKALKVHVGLILAGIPMIFSQC